MTEISCGCGWSGRVKDLIQDRCPDCNSKEDIVETDSVGPDDYRRQDDREKVE